MSIKPAESIAVDLVWKSFSQSGQWPDRHALVLALDDAGFTLVDAQSVLYGISAAPSYDSPSKERVQLNLRGWAAVDPARELLRPLGQVACQLAREFIETPIAHDVIAPGTPWSRFRSLWTTDNEWKQVSAIVGGGLGVPLNLSARRADEWFFRPSVEILRYEHAQSFDDVLRVSSESHGRTRVGLHPAGKYRSFLQRVFDCARCHHEWPSAIPFAVTERDLGFVPDLQGDLSDGGFVRGQFAGQSHDRVALTPEAVTTVDDSGEGRALLLRVIAECRARWRMNPGVEVSSADIASVVGIEERAIKPWLLFLEWSPWKSESTLTGEGSWTMRSNEMILRYRDIDSWDDYLVVPKRDLGLSLSLGGDDQNGGGHQRTTTPDLSSVRGRLRRLLRDEQLAVVIEARLDEFARVFPAEAWLAAMILLGSATEGVLLDVLGRNAGKAETVLPSRRRTARLEDAGLGDLVHAAEALKLISAQVKAMASGLKAFRDLVHPNRATASTCRPTPEAVRASAVAFENLVVEMDQAIDDGRMAEFER